MKKIFTCLSALLLSASIWAQAPQNFSYQAVVRGANNTLVTNKAVGMKISLLQDSENGTVAYAETHTPIANDNGLVSVSIGAGTKISGDFATIDWAKGPYFVKTEMDPTGGTSYSLTSVSQLLSVPYALYAANSQPGPKGDKGDTGAQGIPGKDGVDGKNGIDGKDGLPGVKGETGVQGPKGDQGIQGLKGDAGLTGAQGLPGKDGVDGKNGIDGKDGLPGAKGETGVQGLPGKDGVDGKNGIDGKDGLPGAKGETGAQGLPGKDGEDGKNGVDGKNGIDGKDGLPGAQGATGPAGNGFSNGTATNQLSYWDGSSWTILNPGTFGQTLTMCEDGLTWTTGGVCPTRPTSGYGANVTDVDGNTYKTVYIGTQKWMAENLKVSTYSDGTPIPSIIDNTQWQNNISGAWSYYNNDVTNNAKYGKLYNWYAVSKTTSGNKNVCPTGWHVPTDAEWTVLTDYLGGTSLAGGKMKEVGTASWNNLNTDATNTSLFSALPGGIRYYDGNYYSIGFEGYWWSSTEYDAYDAWRRYLDSSNGNASRNPSSKRSGFSVRCLRD